MSRLLSTIQIDATVQVRNNLYAIGIGVGLLAAFALFMLARPSHLSVIIPTLMLLVIGGTTLLYVAGMILFERDEGTINAVIVSPLRPSEYLWSKIITLTALAMLEAVVMIGGAMLLMYWFGETTGELTVPNVPVLFVGIITIGVIYTLIGIILIVRYDKITDFLIPMAGVAVVLQIPLFYFLGAIKHWLFLLVPTSAPTVLMQGAYIQLAAWEWLYAILYTGLVIIGLTIWAYRAFHTHMIMKVG